MTQLWITGAGLATILVIGFIVIWIWDGLTAAFAVIGFVLGTLLVTGLIVLFWGWVFSGELVW